MLTWAMAWLLKDAKVVGDAGCLMAIAMLGDVVIVATVAYVYMMTR